MLFSPAFILAVCPFLALATSPHLASTITTPLPKRAGLHTQDGITNFNAKRAQAERIAAYVPALPSSFALILLRNSGYSELQSGFAAFEKNAGAPHPLAPSESAPNVRNVKPGAGDDLLTSHDRRPRLIPLWPFPSPGRLVSPLSLHAVNALPLAASSTTMSSQGPLPLRRC